MYIDLSYNSNFEYGFDELVRKIKGKPLLKKPEIQDNPLPEQKTISKPYFSDNEIKGIMKEIGSYYSLHDEDIGIPELRKNMNLNAILFDVLLQKIISMNFVKIHEFLANSNINN